MTATRSVWIMYSAFAIFGFLLFGAVVCVSEDGTPRSIATTDRSYGESEGTYSPMHEEGTTSRYNEEPDFKEDAMKTSDRSQEEAKGLDTSTGSPEAPTQQEEVPPASGFNEKDQGADHSSSEIQGSSNEGTSSEFPSETTQTSNVYENGNPPTGSRPNNEDHSPTHTTTELVGAANKNSQKLPVPTKQDIMESDHEEEEKDVCFSQLGCFSMGKPWKSVLRPISAPQSPQKIATTVFFYSRQNLDKQKNITVYPQINMGGVQFNPNKLTVIIVHGFASSGSASWVKDMKNAYLKHVDANVMIVDWTKGSQLTNYLQVAGNTRVVGRQMGIFVNHLKQKYGADPGKIHLIGHSLGAQICSYLAKDVPGIARLTALDPAQPGFEGFDKEVRLDSSDAEFVDVVHTDARPFIPTLGFGMIAPHGHVDFYMNGGFDQPGCIAPPKEDLPMITNILDLAKFPVEVLSKMISCPHGRSYEYLTEAFNETEKCIFWGHRADVPNILKSVANTVTQGLFKKYVALSSSCSKEDCIPLGFATKKSPLRGAFVVTTSAREPYCISEKGIPPESQGGKRESYIQKIAKKVRPSG